METFLKKESEKLSVWIWIHDPPNEEDIAVLMILNPEEQQVIGPEIPPPDTRHVPNHIPSLFRLL